MSGVRASQPVQIIAKMGLLQYIKGSFEELNTNMTWISKEEAQKSTVIVASFSVVFALMVFAIDKVFQLGLDRFFNLF